MAVWKVLKTTSAWAFYGIAAVVAFTVIYEIITPCREWKMMLVDKNKAAFASFRGAIFGFTFPVLVAIAVNHAFERFAAAVIASAIVQLALYMLISFLARGLINRMREKDEIAGHILATIWMIGGLCVAAAGVGQ